MTVGPSTKLVCELCPLCHLAQHVRVKSQKSRPADFGQHGAKTVEKLLGSKSPDKAFEVQTEYAKAAYESYVSHATKLGQLYADLGQEAFKSYQDLAAKVTLVK